MRDIADGGEIVGDEQRGEGVLVLEVLQQIQDLRLDRDVESADRLVEDDERGARHEGASHADALQLTTRELVGDTIDTVYFPYALLTFPLRVVHWALDGLGTRAKLIDQERIIDNALDPYALTKDFYLQYNDGKVTGRQPELKEQQGQQEDDSNLDEYLDEIDQ